MINNMDMDKDLSTFGEATYSKANPTKTACSSRLVAADEKKNWTIFMVTHHFTVTSHTCIVNSWRNPLLIVYHLDDKKSKIRKSNINKMNKHS